MPISHLDAQTLECGFMNQFKTIVLSAMRSHIYTGALITTPGHLMLPIQQRKQENMLQDVENGQFWDDQATKSHGYFKNINTLSTVI